MTDKARICLGAFAGAHGVRGHALMKVFTQTPDAIDAYGPVETENGARRFALRFVKAGKPGFAIVAAPEIKSREDALSLKGQRVYVGRDALPALTDEDEFYVEDLIGLAVVDEKGAPMGRIAAVHDFGAGDLLEIKDIPGVKGVKLVAFRKETAPSVDPRAGVITVLRSAIAEDEAEEDQNAEPDPTITDETGDLVSDDLNVNQSAMRAEDS